MSRGGWHRDSTRHSTPVLVAGGRGRAGRGSGSVRARRRLPSRFGRRLRTTRIGRALGNARAREAQSACPSSRRGRYRPRLRSQPPCRPG
jgi:hypothetical protein